MVAVSVHLQDDGAVVDGVRLCKCAGLSFGKQINAREGRGEEGLLVEFSMRGIYESPNGRDLNVYRFVHYML